ncbi:WXG100 family type VII secretion target [Nonomuraea sp. NPDC004297]
MSYYQQTYYAAATMAGVAAGFILKPWAFTVTIAIGTMISNPEGMQEAASGWSTGELETLDQELDALKTSLQENGTWEGEAFTAFEEIHGRFKESIANLDEVRSSTGEAVNSAASLYVVGAWVCMSVALAMMAWAIVKRVLSLNPAGAVAAATADSALGMRILQAIQTFVSKHRLMVFGGLAAVMAMSVFQSKATGQIFPGLEAMPASEMDMGAMTFTSDGMTYDENVASLMPEVDETMAQDTGGISI